MVWCSERTLPPDPALVVDESMHKGGFGTQVLQRAWEGMAIRRTRLVRRVYFIR
jgi:hypothetical protein